MVKRFVIAQPCPKCPFRLDVLGGGHFIHPRRAADIAEALRAGKSFVCHETTSCDDDGDRVTAAGSLHCAGAAIVLEREGLQNQLMQVASRLGLWQPPQDPHGVVAPSFAAFVQHHTPPRRGDKKESHAPASHKQRRA